MSSSIFVGVERQENLDQFGALRKVLLFAKLALSFGYSVPYSPERFQSSRPIS